MQSLTLVVGVVLSVLAAILRPTYALILYITVLLWYPNYLVVSVGTIDISVGRFVVGVLFLRCICDKQIMNKFVWSRLDTWVTLSMAVYVVTTCVSQSFLESLENRAGFLMDTWFAYMVTRFLITSLSEFVTVVKWIAVSLAPLAFLGVIESVTGRLPFALLCGNSSYFAHITHYDFRFGLTRAVGPFSHAILFGCAFAMFLPLIWYIRQEEGKWRVWAYVLSAMAGVGVLSSMSSGPWIMMIVAISCLAIERHKYLLRPLLIFFVLSCVFIAIASNRPFYHVIVSYANPLGGSGWHRAKLIDLAIEHFGEWWIAGYGGQDPGWGEYLGMGKTDITNEFVLAGAKYGIIGVIALVGVLAAAFRGLIDSYKRSTDLRVKSLYWSLGCTLVSVVITWMSVSFFGQMMPLFYCILGMIGSSARRRNKWMFR